jgi:protein associated with RNAse G/E
MGPFLNPGDPVALRGIYNQQPFYVQAGLVVKDSPRETALLIMPGAECMAPGGYLHKKHGDHTPWERWRESIEQSWTMERYIWSRNRFLILLEPEKYYATFHIWREATGAFQCFYINFQLPFVRSHCGFDTLDLDLDIVVDPGYTWEWKDVDDYQNGIRAGGILPEWVRGIELAQPEVFSRIENKLYPLDGSWLDWLPEPGWNAPKLPAEWDRA